MCELEVKFIPLPRQRIISTKCKSASVGRTVMHTRKQFDQEIYKWFVNQFPIRLKKRRRIAMDLLYFISVMRVKISSVIKAA
jgi:hypothetical protein